MRNNDEFDTDTYLRILVHRRCFAEVWTQLLEDPTEPRADVDRAIMRAARALPLSGTDQSGRVCASCLPIVAPQTAEQCVDFGDVAAARVRVWQLIARIEHTYNIRCPDIRSSNPERMAHAR